MVVIQDVTMDSNVYVTGLGTNLDSRYYTEANQYFFTKKLGQGIISGKNK